MNIYLTVEIRSRELDARMLAGLAAAERGHTVIIGDKSTLTRRDLLPPGIFHENSLTPGTRKLDRFATLRERGFLITSQDEEHGLLYSDYDRFARKRMSDETLRMASFCFAWGDHDGERIRSIYPDHADRIRTVGSPRVDLWRPELYRMFASRPRPGVTPGRPYVLFANNFARILGRVRFASQVARKRDGYFDGLHDPYEDLQYDLAMWQIAALRYMVPAIRAIATRMPDIDVIVRPHPVEISGAWHDLIGPLPNVVVTRVGEISRWVRGASAVVYQGDTTGFEAAVSAVPAVAYAPHERTFAGEVYGVAANRVGHQARDLDELTDIVRAAVDSHDPSIPPRPLDPDSLPRELTQRLASLTGGFAFERIVDSWEELTSAAVADPVSLDAVRAAVRRSDTARRAQASLAWVSRVPGVPSRSKLRAAARSAQARRHGRGKFAPIAPAEIDEMVQGFRTALGRFEDVHVVRLGERVLAIVPASARNQA